MTYRSANCVAVFTPNGQMLRSFGTYESGLGHFHDLCGLTLDGEGNVLVADCWNRRIQKFTAHARPVPCCSGC